MQIGIVGLAKAGKTTLFNLLTGSAVATDKFAPSSEPHLATATVPDRRLAALRDLYRPRRYVPATVDYLDIPGIRSGEAAAGLDYARLREVDALAHVVRAFEDPEILHPEGSVGPARDVEALDVELVLADLLLVERRLERLRDAAKRGLDADEKAERELLAGTVLPALESERPVRALELPADSEKRLRGYQLLSGKPLLVVVNVDEARLGSAADLVAEIGARPATAAIEMSAPVEEEISRLPAAEQGEFLADLGLDRPSVERVLRAGYELLGLISFFTVGEDEVRAWTLRRGDTARQAARAIHSDIARGFIRAEVVPWDELLARGSMAACREAGTLRLEGKEYPVADGEVVHFRFNV